jgi:hypothetical protein
MNDSSGAAAQASVMDLSTKEWIHEAARAAKLRYPGAVGELLRQELLSWIVFGHQLGSGLIMRVAAEILADDCNIEASDDPSPGKTSMSAAGLKVAARARARPTGPRQEASRQRSRRSGPAGPA